MKRQLSIFYLYQFFMGGQFSRGILMIYCLSLGLSPLEFGILQSTYNLIRLVAEIPTGMLADKYSRKNSLAIGAFLNSFAYFGLFGVSFIPTTIVFLPLVFLFALDSFATVLASGADQALLYEELAYHQAEQTYLKRFSNSQVIALCLLALSTALGGAIFEWIYSTIFLLQATCYLCAGIAISLMPIFSTSENSLAKNTVTSKMHLKTVLRTLSSNPVLLSLITFMTIIEVYLNALVRFIQGALANIHLSTTLISTLIGLATFCGILGAFGARFLQPMKRKTFLLLTALTFLLANVNLSQHLAFLVIGGFIFLNLLIDLIFPYISQQMNQELESSMRSTILSFYSSLVGGISLIFYPFFGFLLTHFSYSQAFLITGSIFGCCLLLIALLTANPQNSNESFHT